MSAPDLGDVAATSLITLDAHARETQSAAPVLVDPKAVEVARTMSTRLAGSDDPLVRDLLRGSLDPRLVVHIALRARRYDTCVRAFLAHSPGGVVVNIGCGLDSRVLRVDNGRMIFYDLDLPEVIALRREFYEETDRCRLIASSVLEDAWIPRLQAHDGPFLFLAEGVFMYLEAEAVKGLVVRLAGEFPGSELVCEVVNAIWVREPLRTILQFKLRRELHMGKDAVFRSGIRDGREPEEWHPGIRLLDEWSYFDADEPKLGWLRLFRHSEFLRTTQ